MKMILIITKQHSATGVAHLYEHLFEMEVHDFFYRNRLSPYVDYSLHTQTLAAGVVYVDIRFYTTKAQALANKIKNLSISYDEQRITSAVTQVMAELEKAFKITKSLREIGEELGEIDVQPWQEINNLDEIDPKSVTIAAGSFYTLKDAEKIPSIDLRVNFTLDKKFADSHRELLPLFWQLARLMNASVKADFHRIAGVYSKDVTHTNTIDRIQLTHHYFLHRDIPLQAPRVLDQASKAIRDLQQANGIARFVTNLRKAARNEPYGLMPNPATVFHQSGVLIGAEGWKRIATDENRDLILSHTKLGANVDNEHVSTAVSATLTHTTKPSGI